MLGWTTAFFEGRALLVVSSGGEVRGGEGRVASPICFFGFCGIVGRGLGAREITIDVGAIRLATGQFLDAANTPTTESKEYQVF